MKDTDRANLILFSSIIIIIVWAIFSSIIFRELGLVPESKLISEFELVYIPVYVTLMVFIGNITFELRRYAFNQEKILKDILFEIEYLDMKGGHIGFFEDSMGEKGYPHHKMMNLSIQRFTSELSHKINGRKTSKIRKILIKANDKINMLNEYRRDIGYWKERKDYAKSDVIPDLRKELSKLKNVIDEIRNPEFI